MSDNRDEPPNISAAASRNPHEIGGDRDGTDAFDMESGSDMDMGYGAQEDGDEADNEWESEETNDEDSDSDDQKVYAGVLKEYPTEVGSESGSEEGDGGREEFFAPIMAQIKHDAISGLVLAVRKYYDDVDAGLGSSESDAADDETELDDDHGSQDEKGAGESLGDQGLECCEESNGTLGEEEWIHSVTVNSPIFGKSHILYPLEFEDGIKWILKIPANGTPDLLDPASKRALRSEASTVDLLSRKTTIPLPRVFGFEEDCGNELGCPFILMEYIAGKRLSDFWYHKASSESALSAYRSRILKDIAGAMAQLNQFSCDEGGITSFDNDGEPDGIGPFRFVKHRQSIEDEPRKEWEMPTFIEAGPFEYAETMFKALLKQHRKPRSRFGKGALEFLRKFLSCFPDTEERSSFVLAHPNLELDNIVVSEHGQIKAFIGWTGVSAVPQGMGNESYPRWLMHDVLLPSTEESGGDASDSDLSSYRGTYDQYMIPTFSQRRALNFTEKSHVAVSLYIAASRPESTITILANLFDEMVETCGAPPGGLGFREICYAIQGRSLTKKQDYYLDDAFEILLSPPECNLYRYHGIRKWFDRDWPEPEDTCFPYL
ncbi:hypothetical protein FQN54_005883 [Arachnomyces sp. PD_36]|nr:hypothetical protein FQN54_005883 [Arachnomyces sp. PD_36]